MTETELLAHQCPNGHLTHPGHARCPECGQEQTETVDLSEKTAQVITWTSAGASPTGVREPNPLAIVEFTVGDRSVRAIGGTTDGLEVGDTVEPVFVEQLRDPDVSSRATESQPWSGYRFAPVDE